MKPVSDLRNKFSDIEKIVNTGEPVFLTKNGYGSMVVMSIEAYAELTDTTERALDEADKYAESNPQRMSHTEVFSKLRERIHV
ncbi:MAG: type II toxin-antitoxin system Phd/YefM family antitoxin [Eubacteriales bacterium]|nr:type II toxin-antitoxin system Phd/YefM family antitoxin [Eubacteriales bacterium]